MRSRRFFPLALSVILGLLVPLASPLRADELDDRFAEANQKLDAGENQAAMEIYNEILEAEPTSDNVLIMRAVAKWNLKDVSGARADLALALNIHPENIVAYRTRAMIRYQSGDVQNSLVDLNRAIDLTKDEPNPELFAMRGEAEKALGQNADALRDLTRAIELNDNQSAAFYLRGQIHEVEKQAAAAEADYDRVIELEPDFADVILKRAWIRFHAENWDGAITDAQRVLELAPKNTSAGSLVGYAQFARGDYADAAQSLTQLTDEDTSPEVAYVLFVRHHALLRTGGADDRLAQAWTTWVDQDWLQALAKFLTGKIDEEALETVANATDDEDELKGRACEMHFYVGLVRRETGDRSTARLRFKSALAVGQTTYVEDALSAAELKRI